MHVTKLLVAPVVAAAGAAVALTMAPAATAQADDCAVAVSTSRCLGPSGVADFAVPSAGSGSTMNGPYGAWGNMPPIG